MSPLPLEHTIYHADALTLLERLPDESYELVYLDPPFSQTDWLFDAPSESAESRNSDATLYGVMMLYAKLFPQVRRVLKPNGNVFIQLEAASHGLTRVLLDRVFARENFEREIVWIPRTPMVAGQQHETISWYRRGPRNIKNDSRELTPEEIKERTDRSDDRGPYHLVDLTAPMRSDNSFEWRGYLPPDGRGWRFTREGLDQLDASGDIEHVSGRRMPRRKVYFSEIRVPIGNVWTDIASEHLRQKSSLSSTTPLRLAERILQVGSNTGGRVLDLFCGTGTVLVAAERLGRSWTGGDASALAVEATVRRLRTECSVSTHLMTSEELKRVGTAVHAVSSAAVERLVDEFAPSDKSPLRGPLRLGEVLPVEEGREVEFKEIKGANPVDAITSKVDEYVVAFLNNGSGGRIIWGIADNGRIVGVALNRSQRDAVRRVVTEKLATIEPPIPAGSYVVALHPVGGHAAGEEAYIVEVRVPQVTGMLYFTGSGQAWVKTDGGKQRLRGLQVIDEVLRRNKIRIEERAMEPGG